VNGDVVGWQAVHLHNASNHQSDSCSWFLEAVLLAGVQWGAADHRRKQGSKQAASKQASKRAEAVHQHRPRPGAHHAVLDHHPAEAKGGDGLEGKGVDVQVAGVTVIDALVGHHHDQGLDSGRAARALRQPIGSMGSAAAAAAAAEGGASHASTAAWW
jgi:hypothetical protein